ncbi:MAG: dipeptide ABC transporter ATP-binding protein [Microcoleaceae cyanobacterium]
MNNPISNNPEKQALVRLQNLKIHFPIKQNKLFQNQTQSLKAVDGISFEIYRGETFSIVGESGCGKSTTGRGILQLERPTGGKVYFEEIDLTTLNDKGLQQMRRRMQMIFQDPYASLNPRMTIGKIISEPLIVHHLSNKKKAKNRVKELLELVGLNPNFINRYPHEFSGGQRQRIGIARALAVQPDFIVCDEPIASLDVSIQAQVINLLQSLQEQFNLTYLFIAHDLSVVRHISERIAVMYLGKVVELADYDQLYQNPLHPYTKALLSAVPIPNPEIEKQRESLQLTGEIPSPISPPSGCRFHTRCPLTTEHCRVAEPQWREIDTGHFVACHLVE